MQLISFGGSQLYRPGAYSVVNVKNATPYQAGSLKVLAAIGSGNAGQPGVPLYFNSPSLAAQRIGGTDVLTLAQIAWEHGADLIAFVLTDQATAGTYPIKDTTPTTPKTIVTLSGMDFNTSDNSIQITVSAPTNGSQTVTITDTGVTPNLVETYTVANTATGWQAFASKINSQSAIVTAGAVDTSGTNIGATVSAAASFTGGTRTAGTATQITAAINALQTEDVQGILATATDSTTLAAIDTHCNTMSNVSNRRERRGFLGQPVGTAVAAYVTQMGSLGGRSTLVAPGMYRSVGGVKTLLPSAFTAAAIAGRWAGNANPNKPVTFEFINALGLENNYLDSDIKTLVTAQVTVVENVPRRGFRIVRALTGDTSGTNLVELSVADLVDIMTRSVREQLENRFVGQAGVNGIVNDIQQMVTTILESFKKQNWIVDGTDAFGQPLPAYRNVTVTQIGTQFSVSFEIAPCLPVNYITINATVNA